MHVGQQTFMSSTCAHSLISAAFKTYNTFNIKKLLQRNYFFPSKFIPYSLQYKPNLPKVCILNIIWRLAKISCLKSRQIWVNLQSLRREDSLSFPEHLIPLNCYNPGSRRSKLKPEPSQPPTSCQGTFCRGWLLVGVGTESFLLTASQQAKQNVTSG